MWKIAAMLRCGWRAVRYGLRSGRSHFNYLYSSACLMRRLREMGLKGADEQ